MNTKFFLPILIYIKHCIIIIPAKSNFFFIFALPIQFSFDDSLVFAFFFLTCWETHDQRRLTAGVSKCFQHLYQYLILAQNSQAGGCFWKPYLKSMYLFKTASYRRMLWDVLWIRWSLKDPELHIYTCGSQCTIAKDLPVSEFIRRAVFEGKLIIALTFLISFALIWPKI